MPLISIVIDSSLIVSAKTNIPIPVKLGASELSALHAELGSGTTNQLKIKFKNKTSTELYAEVHDHATGCYIVKVDSVSNSVDTLVVLDYSSGYADNTSYIGVAGDAVVQNVYDANYICVLNMAQDPSGGAGAIKDSTGTQNGTSGGTMTTGDLVNSDFGKALDFDGSDDYIDLDGLTVSGSVMTIQAMIKSTDTDNYSYFIDTNPSRCVVAWSGESFQQLSTYTGSWKYTGAPPTDGNYHAVEWHHNGTDFYTYSDVSQVGTTQTITAISLGSASAFRLNGNYTSADSFFTAAISKVWISDVERDFTERLIFYHGFVSGLLVTTSEPDERTLSEGIEISDAFDRFDTYNRTLSEDVTFSDSHSYDDPSTIYEIIYNPNKYKTQYIARFADGNEIPMIDLQLSIKAAQPTSFSFNCLYKSSYVTILDDNSDDYVDIIQYRPGLSHEQLLYRFTAWERYYRQASEGSTDTSIYKTDMPAYEYTFDKSTSNYRISVSGQIPIANCTIVYRETGTSEPDYYQISAGDNYETGFFVASGFELDVGSFAPYFVNQNSRTISKGEIQYNDGSHTWAMISPIMNIGDYININYTDRNEYFYLGEINYSIGINSHRVILREMEFPLWT